MISLRDGELVEATSDNILPLVTEEVSLVLKVNYYCFINELESLGLVNSIESIHIVVGYIRFWWMENYGPYFSQNRENWVTMTLEDDKFILTVRGPVETIFKDRSFKQPARAARAVRETINKIAKAYY